MALLEQLKLLVTLSRIDGHIAECEKAFIINIGKANGFPESSVDTLFYQSHDIIIPDNLTDDQRFDYIFSLIQLMKIDERLYQEEIKFCSKIASRLRYAQDVLFELMLKVKSTDADADKEALKLLTQQYLQKK
ncbi:MAG: TerB family tellurite resistance protein [Cyclobacteriaceae bacterium]|nr:TerB family tellurite resistance protein [Cyclobacteriaceae bacterium]